MLFAAKGWALGLFQFVGLWFRFEFVACLCLLVLVDNWFGF